MTSRRWSLLRGHISDYLFISIFNSGEPTPPSITGGTERGRQSQQQPHGGPPYYRPQSFNQGYLGYPRNGPMPYRAPAAGPYNQPMVPGREPWRLDRRTPEAPPQRVPSREGSFREEGMSRFDKKSTKSNKIICSLRKEPYPYSHPAEG